MAVSMSSTAADVIVGAGAIMFSFTCAQMIAGASSGEGSATDMASILTPTTSRVKAVTMPSPAHNPVFDHDDLEQEEGDTSQLLSDHIFKDEVALSPAETQFESGLQDR